MNFNEFYLNSFKDSNDILDGSNVIIKGNVAVNKLNPTQHIDVSGNIKASNKLIAHILELSGNNITVDNSNNITFNKAKFSHIFPAIPSDISASANNANDGGTDIGNATNAFRSAYIQELFVSKNSISLGDGFKMSASESGNLNTTTTVGGVETTAKMIRADPNGQINPNDMPFTGLKFRSNFKPENTSNDNNATELNTLKNSISDLSNGDYLICHSFFKIGQPSSAFTEQVDISGKDISSGDILIWVQNSKWAIVNFKVPYFSLEANHLAEGTLPISKTDGLQTALNNKQNTLTAGTGITINGDTISSSGGLTDLSQTSIDDLSDVSFNSNTTTNGKALIWNSTTKLWEPGQAGNPINETTDVSLNNLKVHGDLSANDASFNNVILNNIIGNTTTTTQSTDNSSNRIATTGFVKNNIQSIINNAPAVLDTLSEIASAIDNSANFATNINSNISTIKSDIANKQNSFSVGSHLQMSSNILNVIPSTIKSSDLSDISFNLPSIQNNQVLAWDSTNNYFTNSNIITQQITTLSSEVARDISNIVNGAPAVLDTLKELADAIDGSANFATNVKTRLDSLQSQINTKNSTIDNTTNVQMKDLSANDASFNNVDMKDLSANNAIFNNVDMKDLSANDASFNNVEIHTLNINSKVGIGISNPSKKLEVVGDISCNALIVNGVSITQNGGSGTQVWTTVNTNEIYYNGGNVGIGTNNPSTTLDVIGDISCTTLDVDTLILTNNISATKVGLGNVTNESKATMFSSPTFTGTVSGVTSTHVGLGNVTNESKATMFSSPTFTGTVSGVTSTHVGLGNVTNESKATMFSSPTFTGTVSGVTSTHVGLGNVTNESKETMFTDPSFNGTVSGVTATHVGLGNVTNESKATMFSSPTFTGTVSGVTSTHVGLGNVTNESKATMFSSPTFTGTVSGVTSTHVGLGNVTNESKATMFSSPTFTGTVSGVTSTHVGLGNVTNESKATMFSSPTFTGNATATTQTNSNNSTRIATTAFVKNNISDLINGAPGALDTLNELASALDNSANFASNITNRLTSVETANNSKTTEFTITVSSSKYHIDSNQQQTITLLKGFTYKFVQNDSTNNNHPIKFSTTSDGTHNSGSEYTTGVTTNGYSSSGNTTSLQSTSIVNIVSSSGNKYVFNNGSTYDSTLKYTLTNGTYTIQNIPEAHPIAILNNGNTSDISYSLVNDVNSPIIIKVSGGSSSESNGDYYTFKDNADNSINIGNGTFRFMRGRTYKFQADGISSSHPFKIYMSGTFQNDNNNSNSGISGSSDSITITIPTNHSTTSGDLYYQCSAHSGMLKNLSLFYKSVSGTTNDASYDFYYGSISITVNGDFDKVSVYCYYHGYMGGENLFEYPDTYSGGYTQITVDKDAPNLYYYCSNHSGMGGSILVKQLETTLDSKQATIDSSNRLNANLINDGNVDNDEFGYLNGVTSSIQTQLDSKQATISSSNRLNANLINDGNVDNTEFGYLNGVTSSIQTQLDSKHSTISSSNRLNANLINDGNVDNDEFGRLNGVTSNIQTQLDSKQATISSSTDLTTGDISGADASFNKVEFSGGILKGHLIPDISNVYDIGSATHPIRELFLGPSSLYIDGKKVIESNADTINVTTDNNQNLTVKTTGSGLLKFESDGNGISMNTSSSGDITLAPNGSIKLNSNIQIANGVEIQNPNGDDINFIDNITVSSGKKFIGDGSFNTITLAGTSLETTLNSKQAYY